MLPASSKDATRWRPSLLVAICIYLLLLTLETEGCIPVVLLGWALSIVPTALSSMVSLRAWNSASSAFAGSNPMGGTGVKMIGICGSNLK